jgi:hypothetical protein
VSVSEDETLLLWQYKWTNGRLKIKKVARTLFNVPYYNMKFHRDCTFAGYNTFDDADDALSLTALGGRQSGAQ